MTLYFLKQAWAEKTLENLEVTCDFSADEEEISAVFHITEPSVKAEYSEINSKVYEE